MVEHQDIEEFEEDIANLLCTPPSRVLALWMVLDKGPTRDESSRAVEVRLRFRLPPTNVANAMEAACAVMLKTHLTPDQLETWLNTPPNDTPPT